MRRWLWLAAAVAAIISATLAWHWSPGRQVRLHQRDFLAAVERRDWARARTFVAEDYRDAWGQSRAELLERLPMAFQDFLACGVLAEDERVERTATGRLWRARLRAVGSGGPIAQEVIEVSGALREPFTFTWRRAGWPWDWQLTRVEQPELSGAF